MIVRLFSCQGFKDDHATKFQMKMQEKKTRADDVENSKTLLGILFRFLFCCVRYFVNNVSFLLVYITVKVNTEILQTRLEILQTRLKR